METAVRASGIDHHGIVALAANHVDFDTEMTKLSEDTPNEFLAFKPFLLVVRNVGAKTVVAYTVRWTLHFKSGQTAIRDTEYKYPDAVLAPEFRSFVGSRELRPGEQRLSMMGVEVGSWIRQPEAKEWIAATNAKNKELLGLLSGMEVSISGAILADGSAVGTDPTDLADHFQAYVDAKREIYSQALTAVSSGQTLDRALKHLNAATRSIPADGIDQDIPSLSRRLAVAQMAGMRGRVSSDSDYVNILKSVAARPRFVVKRVSETQE
jgi:hypothetical protein